MGKIEKDIAAAVRTLENDITRTQHALAVKVVKSQMYSKEVILLFEYREALNALRPDTTVKAEPTARELSAERMAGAARIRSK